MKQVALVAGITKKVHPHALRRTIATYLLEQGMPIDQVQDFLGHDRIDTTRIYAKNSVAGIKKGYTDAMRNY